MTKQNAKRIGIFIDGSFFNIVSDYYNYTHERRSRISFQGVEQFVVGYLAQEYQADLLDFHVVGSHYFRGRFSAGVGAEAEKLYGDRVFDEVLMRSGVSAHHMPMNTQGHEKGIDVLFALTAYEQALRGEIDVAVLLTSDSDFVPLARKLRAAGVRTVLLSWEVELNDNSMREVRMSRFLHGAVDFGVLMHDVVEDPGSFGLDPELVEGLFLRDSGSCDEADAGRMDEPTGEHQDLSYVGEYRIGKVKCTMVSDNSDYGFGFIVQQDGDPDIWFHHSQVRGFDFAKLEDGQRVRYEVSMNAKGLCANNVELI